MKKKTYDKIIEQINLLPWKSMFALYSYYIDTDQQRRNNIKFKRCNEKEFKIKIKELILKYCNYYIAKQYSDNFYNYYEIDPHIFIIIQVISIKIEWEQQIWRVVK